MPAASHATPPAAAPTSDRAASTAALETLAALLDHRYYSTCLLTGPGRTPRLTVAHRYARLAEDIYADDGWYWSGYATRIAPFTDPAVAAADITHNLNAAPPR